MPTPESEPLGNRPDGEHPSDRQDLPYYRAAQFGGEQHAGRAYERLQAAIFRADCDLSSFRFQLNRIYHVAAVGTPPPEDLERRIKRILSSGTPIALTEEVLRLLQRRRAQATQLGPWVEGHYNPRLRP